MSLCDRCKNKCKIDVIEIKSCINFVGEAPHKIVTNFDRITASPEALAKFLGTWFVLPCELCEHFRYDKDAISLCTAKVSERHCDDAEAFEKWLNEESKE